MKKKCGVFLVIMAFAIMGVPLAAQEEGTGGKVNVTLDFSASALSVTSTEDSTSVDSFADAGFGEDNESTLSVSYEGEIFGGVASLGFVPATLHFLSGEIADMFAGSPFSIDELYGWVKPFGPALKFTAGIFENTDGIGDYTDDIDEYGIGVFFLGEEGEPFAEPDPTYTGPALTNGFLADFVVSPVTLQLLFASNYSGDSGSELASNLLGQMYQGTGAATPTIDTKERFFRLGGRVIFDAGVGTFSAVFKTHQWPMVIVNAVEGDAFPGKRLNYMTFGGYFDWTAVENLGVSVGYTGFLANNDDGDVDSVLFNGIDLRATWTGIEGLSLSTHNNISFAQGAEKDWLWSLGKDASLFTIYNGIGATKELTDKFSINAVISNIYSKTAFDADSKAETDTFGVSADFIVKVAENAEFKVGAALGVTTSSVTDEDSVTETTFSIPVGITLSF